MSGVLGASNAITVARCPNCGCLLEDTPQTIYCPRYLKCGYAHFKQEQPIWDLQAHYGSALPQALSEQQRYLLSSLR